MSPGKFIYPNIVRVMKVLYLCCYDIILFIYIWHKSIQISYRIILKYNVIIKTQYAFTISCRC